MVSPDPVAVERAYYLNLLGLPDNPALTLAILRGMTGGGARVESAAAVGDNYVTDADLQAGLGTITKTSLGLANVDNTSDLNKPISNAESAALALLAPKANPTFTGTVNGITKGMVGLGNVDNTSDVNKPISTAVSTALASKLTSTNGIIKGIDGKTYVLISCVIRNTGSGWGYINDTGHNPTNVGTLVQGTSSIDIPYQVGGSAFVGSKVSSWQVTCDETYAGLGVRIGASVGTDKTTLQMFTEPWDRITDYVEYNGTTWTSQNGVFTPSYNGAGVLTLTHETMDTGKHSGVQVSPRGTAMAEPGAYGATSFTVAFYTGSFGSLVATGAASAAQHRVYVTRYGKRASVPPENPANLSNTFGNFWITGLIEV